MPSTLIKNLNRTALATRTPTDSSGVFAGIQLDRRNLAIRVKSISFGCLIPDATDKAAFSTQYAFIARNYYLDENSALASNLAPISIPAGAELIWTGFIAQLGGNGFCDFGDEGLILPAGENYVIVCSAPSFTSGAPGTTCYLQVSVNAELTNTPVDLAGFRIV